MPPQSDDLYCVRCGRPTGFIEWTFSLSPQSGDKGSGGVVGSRSNGASLHPSTTPPLPNVLRIRPGERFYLVVRNAGIAPVRVDIDAQRTRGVELQGAPTSYVAGGQGQAFELRHREGEPLGGVLVVRSEDGSRRNWWERRTWRAVDLRLAERVHVQEERWIIGSSAVVFPPGVRRQYVRVWNDSDQERAFHSDSPAGYRLLCYGNEVARKPPGLGAYNTQELLLEARNVGPHSAVDEEWLAGPEGARIPLIRLPGEREEEGAVAVVAVDFGTRNTGVRVRWRRSVIPSKPAGTVDSVGDLGGSARFPTAMALHKRERTFYWGTEAASRIDSNRLEADEVAIDNLKTHLRERNDVFAVHNPAWTNEELLARYFERIFARLDDYFRTADPSVPLSRESMKVRYVFTRPVMDFNEGDAVGQAYEAALLRALARCGVPEEQVTFTLEPAAAAIGIAVNRQWELLGLREDAVVAVVDAGGGTTDVSLARVRMQEGRVSLEIVASYALRLTPDNPALPALERYNADDRLEFGGNVLDCALAYRLEMDADDILETDLRPVPSVLQVDASTRFENDCRRMKEGFAWSSRQYLYRNPNPETNAPRPQACPFPDRPEYEGVYLDHSLYDDHVQAPILRPIIAELSERMGERSAEWKVLRAESPNSSRITHHASPGIVRPAQVERVFHVGGTNIEPFARMHFSRAFPYARSEQDEGAQSAERIAERLNAVVEGAVWLDERLFPPSPLTLILRLPDEDVTLVTRGAALKPSGLSFPIIRTRTLEPWEEIEAALVAADGGLPEPLTVARAFYRNNTEEAQEVTLRAMVSRERGAVAILQVGDRPLDQWRFALV